MNFHNLICSKKINTGCLNFGGAFITEFWLIHKYADANKHTPLVNAPWSMLKNQNNGDEVNKVKGKVTKSFSSLLKIAKKGQLQIENIES